MTEGLAVAKDDRVVGEVELQDTVLLHPLPDLEEVAVDGRGVGVPLERLLVRVQRNERVGDGGCRVVGRHDTHTYRSGISSFGRRGTIR